MNYLISNYWIWYQLCMITIELILLGSYSYTLLKLRRAEDISGISVPYFWKTVIVFNIAFMIAAIIVIAIIK